MKKKTSQIELNELLRKLAESGFVIELREEAVLRAQSKKSRTRTRKNAEIKGLIAPDSNIIYINSELDLPERVKTVLHEMIHLHDEELSEEETERRALAIYRDLPEDDLGYLEFLVS